jgi:hypothetical protein
MQTAPKKVDFILSTLNAAEIGSLDSIREKMIQVREALAALEQPVLVAEVDAALAALGRCDVPEFKRLRAFLQAKVGHLR